MPKSYIYNDPLEFSFATALLDDATIDGLYAQACYARIWEKFDALCAGEPINSSEGRAVTHLAARRTLDDDVKHLATEIRANPKITTIVQIGIGGSLLGPQAIYDAIVHSLCDRVLTAKFYGNLDPDDLCAGLMDISLESSVLIIASKSGGTAETLSNLALLRDYAISQGISDIEKQCIVVTQSGSPLDDQSRFKHVLTFDEGIGGRYSLSSAVGTLALSCCFGPDVMTDFLDGARAIDAATTIQDPWKNMCLMAALIGHHDHVVNQYPAKAIVPYAQHLAKFVTHLQQLDCESNGKAVRLNGSVSTHPTGPIVFGGPGSHTQHSFFQHLHQSPTITPIQFIGFRRPQTRLTLPQIARAHSQLLNNMIAQMIGLAEGQDHDDPVHRFSGGRPSTLIMADQLTARTCGALLSFYEHVVMFQGFMWDLNSFDQPGVQLGKTIADELAAGTSTWADTFDWVYDRVA